jgi:DNA-binding CsgD family transcriptional regulator
VKRILLYSIVGGILITLLKLIEYQYFVRTYPAEVYGGLLAVIFTVVGIYLGLKWTRTKEVVVVKEIRVREEVIVREEVPVRQGGPFVLNTEALQRLGITPREHEILGLIAQGLTNREIGEKLFVSENTVKTHSTRVFEKLSVNRRVQAIEAARKLGLIP